MHPLGPDLTGLSDDELHTKYSELQKRFGQAYRFGPQSIIPQLQMLMQDYQKNLILFQPNAIIVHQHWLQLLLNVIMVVVYQL